MRTVVCLPHPRTSGRPATPGRGPSGILSPLQDPDVGNGGVELQLSSAGKLARLRRLEVFLLCSFTLKIAAHMLVATSLSPRSSLKEWELAGWMKVYRIHSSTPETVTDRVALWNSQGYGTLGRVVFPECATCVELSWSPSGRDKTSQMVEGVWLGVSILELTCPPLGGWRARASSLPVSIRGTWGVVWAIIG